jgi:hypothetical protein
MATTTPSFGWPVPTSTDLVKDGATAIESLGDAIDASLTDLKGGTTGQVLSKASATDMDFTWVAQDDSNAIQNAIVDAKGDLIAATAADTPARLAVGTNGHVLTADSAEATGLKWAAPSSGALTLIGTTTLSSSGNFNLTSIFSSTYDNYLIIFSELVGSSATFMSGGLRTGATNATANYNAGQVGTSFTGSNIAGGSSGQANIFDMDFGNTSTTQTSFQLFLASPFIAKSTTYSFNASTQIYTILKNGIHAVATSYDSFWVTINTGTLSGKVSVYGYAK